MLSDYAGTILLISHDRDFLDRLVNAVIVPEGAGRWIEYAGGYSDMLAQRGVDLSRDAVNDELKVAKSAPKPTPRRAAPERKRRLSFNEKHELETLPATMAALQSKIKALHRRLGEPELYTHDRKAFDEASAALAAAHAELAAAEEKWLELEILREEIAAQ
jgi:ATP-binding cassette subfamily F protein uup